MDNVVAIIHSLNNILGRIERGEGLLGELTSDSADGRRLQGSLVGASETLQRIADKVEHGPGPAAAAAQRPRPGRPAGAVDRPPPEPARPGASSGQGLLPGLLNDPASRDELNQTLATLHQVANDLQGFTGDLESSDALLPRLVKDEAYGREVTEQIRQLVERLNAVAGKLDQGNGTAAKLINDPKIYDAVNDIMIGVNQSKLLRWLIRNRQKKGIEKRYDDTKKAIEDAGGTPEPLDARRPEDPRPRRRRRRDRRPPPIRRPTGAGSRTAAAADARGSRPDSCHPTSWSPAAPASSARTSPGACSPAATG